MADFFATLLHYASHVLWGGLGAILILVIGITILTYIADFDDLDFDD